MKIMHSCNLMPDSMKGMNRLGLCLHSDIVSNLWSTPERGESA